MGVYVIREGLAEADELLPSWGLGTGQVWCMATLTCLCLQEWDGTRAIQVTDTRRAKLTEHARCPRHAVSEVSANFRSEEKLCCRNQGLWRLCSMKGGLFAAARPVWLYNSNLQAASLHHSTSHSSGSSSAGFCTILKTFYLLPCCIVWLAWHLHKIKKINIHFELCLIKESHSLYAVHRRITN